MEKRILLVSIIATILCITSIVGLIWVLGQKAEIGRLKGELPGYKDDVTSQSKTDTTEDTEWRTNITALRDAVLEAEEGLDNIHLAAAVREYVMNIVEYPGHNRGRGWYPDPTMLLPERFCNQWYEVTDVTTERYDHVKVIIFSKPDKYGIPVQFPNYFLE